MCTVYSKLFSTTVRGYLVDNLLPVPCSVSYHVNSLPVCACEAMYVYCTCSNYKLVSTTVTVRSVHVNVLIQCEFFCFAVILLQTHGDDPVIYSLPDIHGSHYMYVQTCTVCT